jgi:hypothetical protein
MESTAVEVVQGAADLKIWAYAGLITMVLGFLALDLGVLHREAREVTMREAVT